MWIVWSWFTWNIRFCLLLGNKLVSNLIIQLLFKALEAVETQVSEWIHESSYNHATSNLAIYSHETSKDKLLEA